MRVRAYWGLLARNRFRLHILGLGAASFITGMSIFNSVMYRCQLLWLGRRIRRQQLVEPPTFIVGHWRSGTTFLHELLVRDPSFAFPNTYQCFAPNHFLLTEWLVPRLFRFMLPARRPMDNMATGFAHPQEDEFALCSMGAPTPYLRMAFPNRPPPYLEFFNMDGAEERDLHRFERSLKWFFNSLTLKYQKRLVLKSPPHTGRIELLTRLFPGARFVHLVRHPYELFSSTLHLWRTLDRNQGFQLPRYDEQVLRDYVLTVFDLMYEGFNRQRELLAPEQLIEVKFEELVERPVDVVREVYQKLKLGDFEQIKDHIEAFAEDHRSYRPSDHQLDEPTRELIAKRWGWYFERYGYVAD